MKFEYIVVPVVMCIKDETSWLNRMGAEEWELTQIAPYLNKRTGNEGLKYYFKRRVEIGEKLRKPQLKEVPNNDDESSRTTGGIPEEGL